MENTAAKSGSREKNEKCLVILANEEGEEKTFEANEDWIAAIEKSVSKSAHENNYQ